MIVGVVLAVVVLLVFLIAGIVRGDRGGEVPEPARAALAEFAARSLELETVEQILAYAGEATVTVFGSPQAIAIIPGVEEGAWEVWSPQRNEQVEVIPPAQRGLFGWFKHNSAIAVRSDLHDARYGAMRRPLAAIMERHGVDVIMPLVHDRELLAAFGFALGRKPTSADRALMKQLRLEATVACANVRLHREAAHVVSLAQEVDLARAAQQALVPETFEGEVARARWAGHFEAAGEAGSDFWDIYDLGNDRALVVIGDATGAGLAGSMVSAVVKSCCDAIIRARADAIDPAQLLGILNRALFRPDKPVHMTCFAALIDGAAGRMRYANAGHPFPYFLAADGTLGVLSGRGPVLGDEPQSKYSTGERAIASGDLVVFFTDGIVGQRGPDGKAFGERRLQKLLVTMNGSSPRLVRDRIADAVAEFRTDSARDDDEAMLVVGMA